MHIFILPQWKQHLWKSKECFWKSRSCPIRSPRSFKQLSEIFLHVFAHWTGFYALSAREKFEGRNEAGSDQIGSIARDRILLLLLLLLREREREKGSKHGRDVFRKTNEISFHERGRHRREGCCCALHASKVYRACIYERLWSFQFERTREPATIKFPSKV